MIATKFDVLALDHHDVNDSVNTLVLQETRLESIINDKSESSLDQSNDFFQGDDYNSLLTPNVQDSESNLSYDI